MPDNVRQLRGDTRPSRQKNPPKAVAAVPDPPPELEGEALDEWHRVTPELGRLGLLSNIDRGQLALYCTSWAIAWEAARQLREADIVIDGTKGDRKHPAWQIYREASADASAKAKELGLTYASRSRMKAPDLEDAAAELD